MGQFHKLRDKSKKFRREHAAKKVLLWEFQNGYCGCCGGRLKDPRDLDVDLKEKPSEEHVWPVSKFPERTSWGNLILSHWRCNSAKQDRMPTGCELIWLELVNMRYADHRRELDARSRPG